MRFIAFVPARRAVLSTAGVIGSLLAASPALAATYEVGAGKAFSDLASVVPVVAPGDVVLVYGDATYAGGVRFTKPGTAAAKITLRGVRVNGKRPVVTGGANTIEINADHYLVEVFDLTAGSSRCFYHHADDVTLRDTVIHDCPSHGVQGSSSDSGSLTLDHVEIARAGMGLLRHGIYMDTDEDAHPGAVFRMQHCYLHDGNGGNMVKSRAERNEIYYNWIEGSAYRELELIGGSTAPPREDSDVVGNVLWNTSGWYVVRVGGDGTGETNGRYRFVNNTIVVTGDKAVFQPFDAVESIEMHDNAFFKVGGGGVRILDDSNAQWANGERVVAGSHKWVPLGSDVPSEWTDTLSGADPGFRNVNAFDLWPTLASPLRDAGIAAPASPPGHEFPSPLVGPTEMPPRRALEQNGAVTKRHAWREVDIGALETGIILDPSILKGLLQWISQH
jgi:hypothetical protein